MGKGGSITAPTIELGPSIASYQKGIDTVEREYKKSVVPFIQGMTQAQLSQIDSITKSQQLQSPYSTTGYDAMNEFRQFIGLSPLTRESDLTAKLEGAVNKLQTAGIYQNSKSIAYLQSLADKSSQLEITDDPTRRKQLKDELTIGLKAWQNTTQSQLEDQQVFQAAQDRERILRERGLIDKKDRLKDLSYANQYGAEKRAAYEAGQDTGQLTYAEASKYGLDINQVFGGKYSSWEEFDARNKDANLADLGSINAFFGDEISGADFASVSSSLNEVLSDVGSATDSLDLYVPDRKPDAYTAQEITQKLEELPEYKFQLQQGTQALERTQAAKGNLMSGNALLEATQFGQNLAQNVYQGHLSRLANLSGIAMPTAQQQTGMLPSLGQQLGQGYAQTGQFRAGTMQQSAGLQQGGYNQMGQMQGQAAIAQAQMQLQAAIANQQAKSAGFGQALSFGGKLLGAIF